MRSVDIPKRKVLAGPAGRLKPSYTYNEDEIHPARSRHSFAFLGKFGLDFRCIMSAYFACYMAS